MMKPEEKAEQLLKMFDIKHTLKLSKGRGLPVSMYDSQIVSCAIKCADEIIEQWEYISVYLADKPNNNLEYWLQVKQQLIKKWSELKNK